MYQRYLFNTYSTYLRYYTIDVETVDNNAFGVKGGQQGTVDVYVTRNSSSAPAPYESSNLEAYADNYDVFREAVNKGGFDYLTESFGVVSNQVQPYYGASTSDLLNGSALINSVNNRVSKRFPRFRSVLRPSDRAAMGIRGSDAGDIILHPRIKAVVRGGDGSDLHLMNHANRSLFRNSRIAKSVIVDFEDEDIILLRRRQFGRQITFERAANNVQRRRFQQSEADFVFFDPGAQPGAEPDCSSRLFYNANGSEPGWGDEGGVFINFRNGFDLTLSNLATF